MLVEPDHRHEGAFETHILMRDHQVERCLRRQDLQKDIARRHAVFRQFRNPEPEAGPFAVDLPAKVPGDLLLGVKAGLCRHQDLAAGVGPGLCGGLVEGNSVG